MESSLSSLFKAAKKLDSRLRGNDEKSECGSGRGLAPWFRRTRAPECTRHSARCGLEENRGAGRTRSGEHGEGSETIEQGNPQAQGGKAEEDGRAARAEGADQGFQPLSGTAAAAVRILVDADACPVKDEVYRVAFRHQAPVRIVSNSRIRVPDHPLVERVVVSDGFDAADDWIAGAADGKAVVITADILLADRCLKAGATVIGPNGKPFTTASIGAAIATRAIMADLRAGGDAIGGPPPFAKADRSRFLQALDEALVKLKRR